MLKVKTAVDVRQEWTAALRSGKIHQVIGFAWDAGGGMCVWGVLMKITGGQYGAPTQWPEAATKAGITLAQLSELIRKNNSGTPFPVLADEIDALPYTS